jgi:hypothetical protein
MLSTVAIVLGVLGFIALVFGAVFRLAEIETLWLLDDIRRIEEENRKAPFDPAEYQRASHRSNTMPEPSIDCGPLRFNAISRHWEIRGEATGTLLHVIEAGDTIFLDVEGVLKPTRIVYSDTAGWFSVHGYRLAPGIEAADARSALGPVFFVPEVVTGGH